MRKQIKLLLHLVGHSFIVASTITIFIVTFSIVLLGYFFAMEPNPLIIFLELIGSAYGIIYSIYAFNKFVGKQTNEGSEEKRPR